MRPRFGRALRSRCGRYGDTGLAEGCAQRVHERQSVLVVAVGADRIGLDGDVRARNAFYYNLPGVRALVLLKLGLVDLRDLAGPHTKPFGRGPRIGLLDHTDDAGLRVLVPFEIPDDDVLEETW